MLNNKVTQQVGDTNHDIFNGRNKDRDLSQTYFLNGYSTAVPHGNKDDESGFISPVDAICSLNHSPCVLRSLIDLMATAVGGYCMTKGQQECTCSTEHVMCIYKVAWFSHSSCVVILWPEVTF